MTVGELILELERYDKSMVVLCSGYEGGYNDISKAEEVDFIPNYYETNQERQIYGDHESVCDGGMREEYKDEIQKGVFVG